jgi:hypothetical protein
MKSIRNHKTFEINNLTIKAQLKHNGMNELREKGGKSGGGGRGRA